MAAADPTPSDCPLLPKHDWSADYTPQNTRGPTRKSTRKHPITPCRRATIRVFMGNVMGDR